MKSKKKFTKYDFIQFLDCPEELWMQRNNPESLAPLDDQDFHKIEQGKMVDKFAQELFKIPEFLKLYKIKPEQVVFQKRIETKELVAIADVVVEWGKDKIWLFEAKAATKVKDELADDVTFQKVVFEEMGVEVEKCFLVHVNKEYIANGDINVMNLMSVSEITDLVAAKLEFTKEKIPQAINYIQAKEPSKRINISCSKKIDCPFFIHHFSSFPEYSIFDITRLHAKKKQQLIDWEIYDIQDVPKSFELPARQRVQVDIAQSGETVIRSKDIRSIINRLEYPLYFLDYESFSYVIPVQDGIYPYQQMVFQYSLHVQETEDGELKHYEYLLKSKKEPVLNLVQDLANNIDQNKGTIIVWHKSFECSRHNEMAAMYPEYSDFFNSLNSKVFDLEDIFRTQLYVHPKFYGKSSIKKVLPVMVPAHDYGALEISNGLVATLKWHHMTDNRFDEAQAKKTYQDLLEYCKLDTLAMVEIFNVLKVVV